MAAIPMLLVNWHAHTYPPEEVTDERFRPLRFENLLRIHDEHQVDLVVVTNPLHYLRGRSDAQCLDGIRRWHDYAAELREQVGHRAVFFSAGIPVLGEAGARELDRGIREYGFKGVFINSSHNFRYPDEDVATPFWETATGLDIPVMIHAPHVGSGEEYMNMYRLISSVGRPMDECLAIARLIVRGLWEKFPNVTLIGAHGGGGICEIIGRLDYAYELGDEVSFLGSYEPMLIRQKPSDYMQRMYVDTANYWAPALLSDIQSVGVAHALFGADAPPLSPLLPKAIQMVKDLPLSDTEKRAIFAENALRLLRMPDWQPGTPISRAVGAAGGAA